MKINSQRKPALEIVADAYNVSNHPRNCDGCGACCRHVGCPPFLLEMIDGVLQPIDGADSILDHQRILAAPQEARTSYLRSLGTINCECAWLDPTNNQCRHYEHRPDICRTYEVGGAWCLRSRELHQIG